MPRRCRAILACNRAWPLLPVQVCLGFVENRDEKGVPQTVTNDFILKNEFTVDIGGHKFAARANIHSPSLAYKTTSPDRLYLATR